jgi:hypothetical protein
MTGRPESGDRCYEGPDGEVSLKHAADPPPQGYRDVSSNHLRYIPHETEQETSQ